jgi:hypothetical protein
MIKKWTDLETPTRPAFAIHGAANAGCTAPTQPLGPAPGQVAHPRLQARGTINPFAALEMDTGRITTDIGYRHHRHKEFTQN